MQKNQYVHAPHIVLPLKQGMRPDVKSFPLAGLPALGEMVFWPADRGKLHCIWGDGLHQPVAKARWTSGFFACANGFAAVLMRADALAGFLFHAERESMEASWQSLVAGLSVDMLEDKGEDVKPMFENILKGAIPPLYLYGSLFQLRVWLTLAFVPAGEVTTYGELAAAVGQPGAGRAVGSIAMNKNRHLWVLPCHRVIGANGGIGGFGLGLEMKAGMLLAEI